MRISDWSSDVCSSDLKPPDPAMEARFQRIKGKLTGYMEEPPQVMRLYPETDSSVAAHYARAYAWHRSAYPDKAMKEEIGRASCGKEGVRTCRSRVGPVH